MHDVRGDWANDGRSRGWRPGRGLLFGLVAGIVLAVSAPSIAQIEGSRAWGRGGCANCHGGIGQGGGGGEYPRGPNLYESELTRDELFELIACGRPGTPMPFNLAGAYTEHECYGMGIGPAPDGTQQGAGMTLEEVNLLTDFMMENVIDKAPITKATCAAFYGGNRESPACLRWPD